MGRATARAVDIPTGVSLSKPMLKESHTRGNKAFIIRDAHTNDLILAQKLTTVVEHLNAYYARNSLEQVCVRGLYQAAGKTDGYTRGYHKMRYLVMPCELDKAHIVFERARALGAQKATVLTEINTR